MYVNIADYMKEKGSTSSAILFLCFNGKNDYTSKSKGPSTSVFWSRTEVDSILLKRNSLCTYL